MLVCWREGGGACLCVRRNARVCVRACHVDDVMSEGGSLSESYRDTGMCDTRA